jgi:hypothetical protein
MAPPPVSISSSAFPTQRLEAHALAATRAGGVGVEGLIDGGYHEHDSLAGIIIGCAAAREHTFHGATDALAGALSTAFS